MRLRDKYAYAVQTAKSLRMQGSAEERDGKLYFHGTVSTQEDANKIWDAIKTIAAWPREIVADIKATGASAPGSHGESTYAYTQVFNADRDQLNDPKAITPGQVLKIPQTVKP